MFDFDRQDALLLARIIVVGFVLTTSVVWTAAALGAAWRVLTFVAAAG